MTNDQKLEITNIAKEFASAFKDTIGDIAGSGWLIVDPLAGYLDFIGHKNNITQLPATDKHPQVLIIIFEDGTSFIPAGSDLKNVDARSCDWMWVEKQLKG